MSRILKARRFLSDTVHFFALLGILVIPVQNFLLPVQSQLADALLGSLIEELIRFTHRSPFPPARVSSDSLSMYWLLALLLVLSFGIRLLLSLVSRRPRIRIRHLIRTLAVYYLAYRLMEYGADKLFKGHFYQPEPNTLYTPFGLLDRDLLYWSTMGLSYGYNLFLGISELVAACLLLFRRTRTPGLLISLFLLGNIVAVNFGFDISVKLYSLFLFFLALLALAPVAAAIIRFFAGQVAVRLPLDHAPHFSPPVAVGLRLFVLGFLLLSVGLPYFQTGRWNDDRAARLPLHGAYEVMHTYLDGDSTAAPDPFRRFFIHRNGYLIFQGQDDRMQDYRLAMDTIHGVFVLTSYGSQQTEIRYRQKDSLLELHFVSAPQPFRLEARQLNWKQLPALQRAFHWTVEAVR